MKKGILLYNSHEPGKALAIFNDILGKSKDNNLALLYKARIFAQKEEFQEALLCLENILSFDDFNQEALEEAVRISLKIGEFDQGLSYVERILSQKPNFCKFREKKAEILSILGRYEEAGRENLELLNEKDEKGKISYDLGKIHLILKNYEKSIEFFDKSLEKRQFDSKILFKKSEAFSHLGKFDSAILCLEQISEDDKLYDFTQYEKSKIQMMKGNTKQSLELLKKVTNSNEMFKTMSSNETLFENISLEN